MKSILKAGIVLALALAVAAPLAAADKEKKKKNAGKGNRQNAQVANLMKMVAKAEPTSEQKEKIAAIIKEHQPKIAAISAKVGISKEQRQAGAAARKKAASEGKKGKELQAAVAAAQNLSDEQQAAQKDLRQLSGQLRAAIAAVLTEEQREKAGIKVGKQRGKKKKAA